MQARCRDLSMVPMVEVYYFCIFDFDVVNFSRQLRAVLG